MGCAAGVQCSLISANDARSLTLYDIMIHVDLPPGSSEVLCSRAVDAVQSSVDSQALNINADGCT